MNDFLFRVDDGPGVGAGHLMRCLALAEEICQSGGSVHVLATRPSVLHDRWRALGAEVMIRDCRIGSEEDLAFTLQLASQVDASWMIVDGYGFTVDWLDVVGLASKTLCLDDVGERDPSVALVLNHNPGAELRYVERYRRCGQALLGSDWFLLRNEFKPQIRSPEHGQILVCLGGEDSDNRTMRVMQALLADSGPDVWVDVVCNAPPAEMAAVSELALSTGGRFQVYAGPLPLAPLMGRARVMICGGGVTAVEALSMGLEVVAVVLADNQAAGMVYLAHAGMLHVVHAVGDWAVDAAHAALEKLTTTEALNAQQKSLGFDGLGARRVFTEMIAS